MNRMTRTIKGTLLLLLAAVILGACTGKESMQAAEVFTNSMEATESVESFSVEMTMNQKLGFEGESMDVGSKLNLDMILQPELIAYQVMTMEMMGQEMNMEAYLTADGMYMQNPADNSWMLVPVEMGGAVDEQQVSPAAQIEKLQTLVEDLNLETTDSTYELTLSASGDKVKEFIQNELQNSGMEAGMEPGMEALETMEINSLDLKYTIDKETYFPTSTVLTMDVVVEEMGQSIQMVLEMIGTYSNYNQVEPIEIPEEALL